jgi:hypothetical protein
MANKMAEVVYQIFLRKQQTQPSGGNGSHLDMLHGSPFSMGIAHEVDNVFWVCDDWNKDIVRYDFVGDHGPGNDDHSDAIVNRYENIGIDADGNTLVYTC